MHDRQSHVAGGAATLDRVQVKIVFARLPTIVGFGRVVSFDTARARLAPDVREPPAEFAACLLAAPARPGAVLIDLLIGEDFDVSPILDDSAIFFVLVVFLVIILGPDPCGRWR